MDCSFNLDATVISGHDWEEWYYCLSCQSEQRYAVMHVCLKKVMCKREKSIPTGGEFEMQCTDGMGWYCVAYLFIFDMKTACYAEKQNLHRITFHIPSVIALLRIKC